MLLDVVQIFLDLPQDSLMLRAELRLRPELGLGAASNSSIYKFLRLLRSGGDIPSSVQYKSVYASSDFDKAELF